MQRSVRVLTTGGTIASRRTPDGAVVASEHGADLLAGLAVDVDARVDVEEIFLTAGYRLAFPHLVALARRVVTAVATDGVVGVVVTHGTDTMEESAYFVDLILDGDVPVVFTGAQLHADEPDSDGPRNVANAVRLAAAPAARGLGAVVAMAGRAYPARDATKVHTLALDAFAAPEAGPVASIFAGAVHITARPVRPPRFRLDAIGGLDVRVDIVPMYLGADPTLLRAARQGGAAGIVLEAFGAGNANPDVAAEVAACVAAGLVVVVVSRCVAGPVEPIYGAGGGHDLATVGALFGGTLRAPKARLLLAAALAAGGSRDDVVARLHPHLGR